MSENFNSHIACEGTDNDINWVCKVCKDLPNYAGMYLYQREREKNQLKNVKDTCDYALSSQAMEIYRYLGCKTNVIYCEKKAPDPSLPLAVLCKKTATP